MHVEIGDRVVGTDVVKKRDASTALHLVYQLAFPKEHWVFLMLGRFFLFELSKVSISAKFIKQDETYTFSGEHFSSLFLLYYIPHNHEAFDGNTYLCRFLRKHHFPAF